MVDKIYKNDEKDGLISRLLDVHKDLLFQQGNSFELNALDIIKVSDYLMNGNRYEEFMDKRILTVIYNVCIRADIPQIYKCKIEELVKEFNQKQTSPDSS